MLIFSWSVIPSSHASSVVHSGTGVALFTDLLREKETARVVVILHSGPRVK